VKAILKRFERVVKSAEAAVVFALECFLRRAPTREEEDPD
jgi:hypothetical protein